MTKLDINTKRRKAKNGEAFALAKKVAETPEEDLPDECILWPFSVNPMTQYGQVCIGRRQGGVHRQVWRLRHGDPEKGLHVRHKCRNKHCFNPKHLELGTPAENAFDKRRDGTHAEGETVPTALLTNKEALRAYRMRKQGHAIKAIAEKLAASADAIEQVCRGETWKHLGLEPIKGFYSKGRKCKVLGVEYPTTNKAAEAIGVNSGTLCSRLKSPNFPDYQYVK